MSHSEAGPSRRRRKYTSQACNTCRRRKSKCDGVRPTCQPCTTTGHECSWSAEGDEATRPATKQYIEGLRAKIQILETEMTQLKQQPGAASSSGGPMAYNVVLSPAIVSGSIGSSGSRSQVSTPGMQDDLPFAEYIQLTPPNPPRPHLDSPQDYTIQLPQAPTLDLNQLFPPISPQVIMSDSALPSPALTYQYIFNIDSSIAPDEQPPAHQASLQCHWNRYLPDLGAIRLSRHEHDTILSRCFSYGAGWLFGLLPDLFLSDMLEFLSPNSARIMGGLQHYSPLLHCCLLSFGAPLSEDAAIRAKSTRAMFAACAKQWLDQEFNYSNPSLLPSLILLSEYHMGIGENNTGHMYIGMGMRAARARKSLAPWDRKLFGETKSLRSVIRSTGFVPPSPVRDWYHWATFLQEKLVANEIQRSSEMPDPTIPIVPPLTVDFSAKSAIGDSIRDLFSQDDKIPEVLRGNCAPLDVHIELEAWFNSLPEGLLIRQRSTRTPPPIQALHIRYWWSILDLYLPYFNSPDQVANQAVKMCTRATERLVRLFGAYDAQFGFRYFPRNMFMAIYVCARGLLVERSQVNEGTKKRAAAQEGIDLCLRGLRTASEIWPGAEPLVKDLENLGTTSLTWVMDGANS